MKKLLHPALILVALVISSLTTQAQNNVGIGTTTPNSKAILELKATDKGFMAPRMNTLQMLAIAPTATESALLVYNTDSACYHFYNGSAWKNLCDKSIDTALLNKAIKNYLNSNATTIINILKGDTALFNYTTINQAVINILTVDTSITNVAIINNAIINTLTVDSSNTNYANINNANIDSSTTNYAYIKNAQIDTLKSNAITTNSINANTFNGGFSNMDSLYVGGQNIMQTMTDSITAQAWLLKGNNALSTNKLGTLNTQDLHIVANNTERITIANGTGNVGINQTVPSQKLDVAGNLKFDLALMPNGLAGANGDLLVSQGSLLPPQWQNGSTLGSTLNNVSWSLLGNTGTNAGTNFVGTTDAQDLIFKTNGIENMRILNANGNVGIGTATPIAKLQVNGGGYIGAGIEMNSNSTAFSGSASLSLVNANTTNNNYVSIYFGDISTGLADAIIATKYIDHTLKTTDFEFYNKDAGISKLPMVIKANGNVGIGTATPNAKLYVQDAAPLGSVDFVLENTGGGGQQWVLESVGVYAGFSVNGSFGIGNRTNSTTPLVIQPAGNIGIGTASPVTKLDIIGDIKITDGTQGAGKVLTSDAAGKASWQSPSALANYPPQYFGALPVGANCPAGGDYILPGTLVLPPGIYFFKHYSCDGQLNATAGGHFVYIDIISGTGDATSTFHNFINGFGGSCGHYDTGILRCYTSCTIQKHYQSYLGSTFNVPGANAENTVFVKIL